MDHNKTDIFISYRRSDGRDTARTVQLALKSADAGNIFFDYSSLRDGVFNEKIYRAIDECKVFILVLSPESMDRCVNDGDWVTKEIERAHAAGCEIIPLAVNRNYDAWPAALPDSLCFLKDIQQTKLLTDEYFDDSIRRLVERIASAPDKKVVLESINNKTDNKKTSQLMKALELNNRAVIALGRKDQALAVSLFEQASDLGFGIAMSKLGFAYKLGALGLRQDYAKAFDYYSKAARTGASSNGWNGLSGMYFDGLGRSKDRDSAANCLELWRENSAKERLEIKNPVHVSDGLKAAFVDVSDDFEWLLIEMYHHEVVARGKGRTIEISAFEKSKYFVAGFDGEQYKQGELEIK